jgi:hypothetical protein
MRLTICRQNSSLVSSSFVLALRMLDAGDGTERPARRMLTQMQSVQVEEHCYE